MGNFVISVVKTTGYPNSVCEAVSGGSEYRVQVVDWVKRLPSSKFMGPIQSIEDQNGAKDDNGVGPSG